MFRILVFINLIAILGIIVFLISKEENLKVTTQPITMDQLQKDMEYAPGGHGGLRLDYAPNVGIK